MKTKTLITSILVLALFSASACARKPPDVISQQNSTQVSADRPVPPASNVSNNNSTGLDVEQLQPVIATGNFRSDRNRFAVNLPPGWAATEGPYLLSPKSLVGLVAFNSWNQSGFWAAAEHIGNSYSYSRDTIGRQIPDGGAYAVLTELNGPPFAAGHTPAEYTSSNLDGLWTPHDARLDGGKFIWFYKWGQSYSLDTYCSPNASDAVVAQLNALLKSWRFDFIPPSSPQPPEINVPPPVTGLPTVGPLAWKVEPGEARYMPGQNINASLTLTNVSNSSVTISNFPPAICVTPNGDSSRIMVSVTAGTKPRELKPYETVTVNFSWDQKDVVKSQVVPGWYQISFGNITIPDYTFSRDTRVLIQYPQGTLLKYISPNQSQTVNGITVTLQRVDLNSDYATFRVFYTPSGYANNLNEHPVLRAQYTVDGVTKTSGPMTLAALETGIRAEWMLDPVPKDAKELTFSITQIDNLRGPWVFKITLQ